MTIKITILSMVASLTFGGMTYHRMDYQYKLHESDEPESEGRALVRNQFTVKPSDLNKITISEKGSKVLELIVSDDLLSVRLPNIKHIINGVKLEITLEFNTLTHEDKINIGHAFGNALIAMMFRGGVALKYDFMRSFMKWLQIAVPEAPVLMEGMFKTWPIAPSSLDLPPPTHYLEQIRDYLMFATSENPNPSICRLILNIYPETIGFDKNAEVHIHGNISFSLDPELLSYRFPTAITFMRYWTHVKGIWTLQSDEQLRIGQEFGKRLLSLYSEVNSYPNRFMNATIGWFYLITFSTKIDFHQLMLGLVQATYGAPDEQILTRITKDLTQYH